LPCSSPANRRRSRTMAQFGPFSTTPPVSAGGFSATYPLVNAAHIGSNGLMSPLRVFGHATSSLPAGWFAHDGESARTRCPHEGHADESRQPFPPALAGFTALV